MSLNHKIDFAIILNVTNANPNGDPLSDNRPRTDYDGYGEISDVCLKRKLRDRLQEEGQEIFVQSDEKKTDKMPSLKSRAEDETHGLGKDAFKTDQQNPQKKDDTIKAACDKWFDVRAFGQLFAWGKEKGNSASGVSIPIRGPVTIQSAFSTVPISITSSQITKSVNAQEPKNKKSANTEESDENGNSDMSSDRMGMKHRVDKAVYVAYGAMTPQLAEKTRFSDADADRIKALLPRLFEGDASSARPEGSMSVDKLIWWQHNCKSGQYSSAKVHNTLKEHIKAEGRLDTSSLKQALSDKLSGLSPEIIEGF